MNSHLKKEIINQIFSRFHIFNKYGTGPTSDKFLIDKKISFEVDNKNYMNNIWAGEAVIETSKVQFIIADLSEYDPEYCLILQLDNYPPYAARISLDAEDSGSLFFRIKKDHDEESEDAPDMINMWIEATTLIQAKMLVAVESLLELFVSWKINENIEGIYSDLIDFLKFESENA